MAHDGLMKALEGITSFNNPHLFALDTGCVWGGALSALRLDDQQLFQITGKKYR